MEPEAFIYVCKYKHTYVHFCNLILDEMEEIKGSLYREVTFDV